jgi:hypothetical protein
MPVRRSQSIFICYRRTDSPDTVARIYESLKNDFLRSGLFRDIDSIPSGIDFPSRINQVLEACSVVLVVIGPNWIDTRTGDGQRRLDDPQDHVRVEIETALRVGGLRVIPVLVGNVTMPRPEQLPDSIRGLVGRAGLSIRHDPDFRTDMSRLVRDLREVVPDTTKSMLQPLARSWWAFALRGLFGVVLGLLVLNAGSIYALFGLSYTVDDFFFKLFPFYILWNGVFCIVSAIKAPGHR